MKAQVRCALLALAIVSEANVRAGEGEQPIPADDTSIVCNHYLPDDAAFADIRCKDAVAPSGMLLFARGVKSEIALPIQNDRAEAIPAEYTLRFVDRQGQQLAVKSGSVMLPAGGEARVRYSLDTGGLNYGVYSLMMEVSAKTEVLAGREYYIGVVSDAVIPKAAKGDYLYGLDPNYGGLLATTAGKAVDAKKVVQGQLDLTRWVEASGADILRGAGFGIGPGAWDADLGDLAKALEHGWQIVGMAWPPSPTAPGKSTLAEAFPGGVWEAWTREAEAVARQAPEVVYWEIGNEPDLGYPGIEAYTAIYEATYAAIKRGNPKAVVMNGGITFFGAAGKPNSRRFLELVKPEAIDAIAFHAHGHGSLSERNIHEQVSRTAAEFGKGGKMLIDTESGMFVGSKKQEEIQAWTVVQKQAYAQAEGLKFLMTFRLHAFRRGDRGYGMLRSDQEPMPGFLAYRAMTEHLKGLAFQGRLEMSQAHAEGYSFADREGGRRACLLWSNQPAMYNVYVKVAEAGGQTADLRLMDVYGNVTPVKESEDGVVHVEVTEAPVYLLWTARHPGFRVTMGRSLLEKPDMATLVPGTPSQVEIGVRNPSDKELRATLVAKISAEGRASITPERRDILIPARQTVPVKLLADWSPAEPDCAWPETWRVFADVPDGAVDLAAVREEPIRLGHAEGRLVKATSGRVEMLRPGEAPKEKKPGFVFGAIQSDRDRIVKIACNADWWMELRLNGELICSTMERGNEGKVLSERVLELPLKKGTNLLAAKVLSGKGGRSITFASPAELPSLLNPRLASNAIDLTVEAGGKELARELVALQAVRRVPLLGGFPWQDGETNGLDAKPDFALEASNVTNLFDKLPDSSKFWSGNSDLSAEGWIRCDDRRLYLLIRVLDSKNFPGTDPTKLAESDSVEIGVAREGAVAPDYYRIGQIGGVTVIRKEVGERLDDVPDGSVDARVVRTEGETFYRIAVDRRLPGEGIFRLNILVDDNDDGYRKQVSSWASGPGALRNHNLWGSFILAEPRAAGVP